MRTLSAWISGCGACFALFLPANGGAQTYPTAPIRLVVPFSAGGAADVPGRILAAAMQKVLGRTVIVDNRPGAGATIGTAVVSQAPADGYTLLLSATTHVLGPSLYRSLPYHVIDSFTPIGQTGSAPMALAVHPSLPVRSVKDLIALAKSQPGRIDIASSGNGTTQHLFAALFMHVSGVHMRHVPYRGSAPAMTAVLSGEVAVGISSIPRTRVLASSGRLRVLGVTSAERSAQLPDAPTISEAGVAGYDATLWLGLLAPRDVPEPVIERLSSALDSALRLPEVRKGYLSEGTDVVFSTPREFGRFIRDELQKWSKIMSQIGVRTD